MTTAVLSFVTPGIVALRCPELGLDVQAPMTSEPPFARWSRIYAEHLHDPDVLLALGVQMGAWLDGADRWLERLVTGATAPLVLEIETRTRSDQVGVLALDAPWELLGRLDPAGRASTSARWRTRAADAAEAPTEGTRDLVVRSRLATTEIRDLVDELDLDAAYHLALDPGLCFGPVRRIGPAANPRPPSPFRLSVVFMAAQPDGVSGLDVESEEAALRGATGDLGLDLFVDETGSVDGLAESLARVEACDVAHVSCHGQAEPRPVLLLERDDGRRVDVSADDLASAIAGQPPSLTFLSACSTAATSSAGRSLASDLCRRGWPAVLGWSAPVADGGAIRYAARLYRQLSRRQRLSDVVALLRREVQLAGDAGEATPWHLPRLYLGPAGGGRLVDGTRPRVVRASESGDRLGARPDQPSSSVTDPTVRRRALQRINGALLRGERVGALVHGGSERDRADTVRRLVRGWPDLRRVVVARQFDPAAILGALAGDLVDDQVHAITERYRDLVGRDPSLLAVAVREVIEGPAQRAAQGAFVLVVAELPGELGASSPGVRDTASPALGAVVQLVTAFRGAATESRLVLTCAYRFAAIDAAGDDVVDTLQVESLGPPV